MRIVRLICLLALSAGALACRLDGAAAQGTPEVREACTPDAMRLCSDFIPDVAKITACMKRKHRELSRECLTAMRGGHREVRRRRRVVRVRTRCDPFTHMCN